MKNNLFEGFNNFYSVSKTLRFELKPIGETMEHLKMNQILDSDMERMKAYRKVTSLIDEYHRNYLSKQLSSLILDGLEEYSVEFSKKKIPNSRDMTLENMEEALRKQVCAKLKESPEYSSFGKESMITELLHEFLIQENREEEIETLNLFKSFTTYFSGFFLNREHLYSYEEKAGTISYRLVNENLPIFLRNIKVFEKFQEECYLNGNENKNITNLSDGKNLEDIFVTSNFNSALTQEGIERYNLLLTGKKDEDGEQTEGINGVINRHNQKSSKEHQIPKFERLHNQILSTHSTFSFQLEKFENDQEMANYLVRLQKTVQSYCVEGDVDKVSAIVSRIEEYDMNEIFINAKQLNSLSQKVYSDWRLLKSAIELRYDSENITAKTKLDDAYYKKRQNALKKVSSYSVQSLLELVEAFESGAKEKLLTYFKEIDDKLLFAKRMKDTYLEVEDILMNEHGIDCDLIKDDIKIMKIKNYMDTMKEYQYFVKLWISVGSNLNLDLNFYTTINECYSIVDVIESSYDKCRNYLTQKPYSLDKIKINFNNATLLAGWDLNKEKDNYGMLFKKGNQYYLGILNKGNGKLFENVPASDGPCYKKMQYKLLPGPNKMLPKVFFSKKRKDEFNVSDELYEKYSQGLHKKSNKDFDLRFCHELIDFFKESLKRHDDWKQFNFTFKDTKDYLEIGEFYREVEYQGYKIDFQDVPEEYIDLLVRENKMYLFKLHNKDFSEYSKGKKNLHTLYWNALFSESNLKDVVYKLNGSAEIFYRKASIHEDEAIVHEANIEVNNKNPLNLKKKSKFTYDLIKDKRFTDDKFFFHVPMTMNFKSSNLSNINSKVNIRIKNSSEVNVIGIDRGERNLLYICVVNSKGDLIYQESLNSIVNGTNETNYHALLEDREAKRDMARKSWKTVENIKELKTGYLSQAVHKIANLALEYNAIVVLEDLNFGFKRSRIKFEKQVYQKFEKQLIDKFNYLVLKDKDENELAGIMKPLQLTNKFESFKKLGKQSGILYYVPAWKTSKIDPVTGFSDEMNLKYETIEKSKQFFNKFNKIVLNKDKNYYEFHIDDYGKFTNKSYGTKKDWILCSYGERIISRKPSLSNNKPTYEEIHLTEEFNKFFERYKIDKDNIKEDIQGLVSSESLKELVKLFKLLLQMRNINSATGDDYIISPAIDKEGNVFDSRLQIKGLPYDADANGAYNIARKGLMLIDKIKECDIETIKRVKLTLTNQEYLSYLQRKE